MNFLKVLSLFFLLFCGSLSAKSQDNSLELKRLSSNFIELLVAENFDGAYDLCGEELKNKMVVEQLRDLWAKLIDGYGVFVDTGEQFIKPVKDNKVVFTLVNFEKMPLYLKLTYNPQHVLIGIYIQLANKVDVWKRPSYVEYGKIKTLKTQIENNSFVLDAELVVPVTPGPFPVVILVHGSGPQDMDESNGPNKVFKDLALGLATKGVAVFRYNKRSYSYGAEMINKSYDINDVVIDDVKEAIKLVQTFEEVNADNIYVLGHSLGGMLAPIIANESKDVKGIIMLAAPARSLPEMLTVQLSKAVENAKKIGDTTTEKTLIEILLKVSRANSEALSLEIRSEDLPYNIPASFWISLKKLNQVEQLVQSKKPTLLLHAMKDQQVFIEDYNLWKTSCEKNPSIHFNTYDLLNHQFMVSQSEDVTKDYGIQNNVSEEVINDIANWILK